MAGVKHFSELDAWKLCVDLRDRIYELTETGPAARDFKFRNQIRGSAASAASNVAEGWGRFYPNDNAQFLRWARASLFETQNHLLHAQTRHYVPPEGFSEARNLLSRALIATTRLLRYQISCDGQVPGQEPRPGQARRSRKSKTGSTSPNKNRGT